MDIETLFLLPILLFLLSDIMTEYKLIKSRCPKKNLLKMHSLKILFMIPLFYMFSLLIPYAFLSFIIAEIITISLILIYGGESFEKTKEKFIEKSGNDQEIYRIIATPIKVTKISHNNTVVHMEFLSNGLLIGSADLYEEYNPVYFSFTDSNNNHYECTKVKPKSFFCRTFHIIHSGEIICIVKIIIDGYLKFTILPNTSFNCFHRIIKLSDIVEIQTNPSSPFEMLIECPKEKLPLSLCISCFYWNYFCHNDIIY